MNRWALLCLAICVPVFTAQAEQLEVKKPGLAKLGQKQFLQLLVARNVEIQYGMLGSEITGRLFRAEAGLYEAVFTLGIRDDDRLRQRTADERLQNFATGNTAALDEVVRSNEIGVRSKLPWGGELTLGYKVARRTNNLIPQTSRSGSEYNSSLNLSLKQPLMRNAGRAVTETDLRIAELEHLASNHQLKLQTVKSAIEGLTLYWQLHRAEAVLTLREQAYANTQAMVADTKARIEAGKLPATAVLEAQGILLSRQAEVIRSEHSLREAQGKVATALNLVWTGRAELSTQPIETPLRLDLKMVDISEAEALDMWPPYQIAKIKLQQAQDRMSFARNQMRPALDLFFGYSGTGYDNDSRTAQTIARTVKFPEVNFGVNFELPMRGNQKAEQQFLAQSARVSQSELEIESIKNSFSNDLIVRESDLKQATDVLNSSKEEVTLRQVLLDKELERYRLGVGLLSSLIQKQLDLTEAELRVLDNRIRFEVAHSTWLYAQGRLLSDHQIQIIEPTAIRK